MPSGAIHLICGSTGAGETTYALKLADELGAVRFSIDEWMTALYWMDSPQPIDPAWSMARVERCYAQMWTTARQVAERGLPAILDWGFGIAALRAKYTGLARAAGLPVRLHLLDIPAEERWRRVEARNREAGQTYQLTFDVTREMFDFVETMWEPPTPEELAAGDGVRISV